MAEIVFTASNARVIDDPSEQKPVDLEKTPEGELVGWITTRLNGWRDYRRQNYEMDWDAYERLWRMIWSGNEQMRKSERSKIVTAALSEAVENSVAEAEEAIFGRGDFFDIRSETEDAPLLKEATEKNKIALKEDLGRTGYVANVSEILLNGAIYGTGIGEIVVKEVMRREISAARDPKTGAPTEMTVKEVKVNYACLHSVSPKNFLIDPNAKNVYDGLGCAVEEYVGSHTIREGQESGAYRKVRFGSDSGDVELIPDRQMASEYDQDKTHVYRYYGLVPERLLNKIVDEKDAKDAIEEAIEQSKAEKNGDAPAPDLSPVEPGSVEPASTRLVEAVVVIANKKTLLKAVANPFAMRDRSIVAFQWDLVPGRFQGRGVCEKGMSSQKLLDAEMRSRTDAMAYSGAPMMGLDATRLPRGFKMEVYPGRSILTNGDPSTVMKPITWSGPDAGTAAQAEYLDKMVQRACGTVDNVGMAQGMGDARPGAVSMSLAGIVKRHKRTLMSFVDRFMLPSLEKIMWRMMQYYPERYTPLNFSFLATSTLGIMQREYESQQYTALLGTMDPKSPEYKVVLMGLVSNSGLSNRAQLVKLVGESIERDAQAQQQALAAAQAQSQDPMQAELQQVTLQLQLAKMQAEIRELNSRAGLAEQKTVTEMSKPELEAQSIAMKGVYNTPQDEMAAAVEQRMRNADQMIKIADIESNERIVTMQTSAQVDSERIKALGAIGAQAATQVEPAAPAPMAGPADAAIAFAGASTEKEKTAQQREKTKQIRIKSQVPNE